MTTSGGGPEAPQLAHVTTRAGWAAFPLWVRAGALFLAARAVEYLWMLMHAQQGVFARRVTSWDAAFYMRIADHGYPRQTRERYDPAVFFPLFPKTIHVVDLVLPGPSWLAALCVTLVSGTVAAALIAVFACRLLESRLGPDRAAIAGLLTAGMWSAAPMSFVLGLAYGEGFFTALGAGCLLSLLARRWWLGGVLALLAGLARPTGIVLTLACAVAAVMVFRQTRSLRAATPAIGAAVIAPLGWLGYMASLADRTGHLNGYAYLEQRGWGVRSDLGRFLWQETTGNVERFSRFIGDPTHALPVLQVVLYFLVPVLLLLMMRDRLPAWLIVVPLGAAFVAYTTRGQMTSFPRYMLPLFPLLIPMASRLALMPRHALRVVSAGGFVTACWVAAIIGTVVTGQANHYAP